VTIEFKKTIQLIKFSTIHQGQSTEFDFDGLFSNRRVLVVSTTRLVLSHFYMQLFANQRAQLLSAGIDEIYIINSSEWMIGPWVAKHFPTLKGLPDRGAKFSQALADHYAFGRDQAVIATQWQYMTIINDGIPEKLWHNPINNTTPLKVLQNEQFNYHKLGPSPVLKYTGLW
jgi:peroxiredoxin